MDFTQELSMRNVVCCGVAQLVGVIGVVTGVQTGCSTLFLLSKLEVIQRQN
ncbi:MAG: hypothetical protein LBB41_07875 [Prevotellaceae bacterium]|jgi:hypothetical protein|nr:hypothetical protein [Prevotellaceae bacterium]